MPDVKKVIAVVGGTGMQGGGLVRAILDDADGDFAARVLTRNPASETAEALAGAGADVVQADLDNLDEVVDAFSGAYGAYCVTNFWEHFSPDKEQEQARKMAEAATRAGLDHVIWSTLEDTRERVPLEDDRMPTLMGKYKVPHFDAKGEANAYFTERGVPTTLFHTSFYWDNLIHFGMEPQRGPDGRLALTLPMGDKKLPGIAAEDIGPCALGVFKRGEELIGRSVGVAGGHLTGAEMARALSRALGEAVDYNDVTPEVYRGFGFPGAEDLGNMFQYKQEFEEEYCGLRDLERSRELHPGILTFEAWLEKHASRIPVDPDEGERAD